MESFKTPLVVRILDKILPRFLGKDMDYRIVRIILILKLTLDSRRTSALSKAQAAKKNESKNIMIVNFIMYSVFGFMAMFLQILNNWFVVNSLSYGMLIFILLTVYIAEYSEILLDTREKPFYKALPIGEKELALAKNLHISLYIGSIAAVMLLPSFVFGTVMHGVFYGLLYLIMGVAVALLCMSMAGALYFMLLKLFSGEKLKDILNYFQVFMTIAIILGYQIIPRIINFHQISQIELGYSPWLFALPSAWYSAVFAIVFQGQTNWFYYLLFATGVVVLVGLMIANKRLIMPQFEKELSKLEQSSTENKALPWRKRMFCKVFSKNEQERAYMELVSIHLSRERNLKLKLYPQLANAVILPLIVLIPIVLSGLQNREFVPGEVFAAIQGMPLYLAIYFMVLIAPGIYYIICQSDDPATLWIYQVLPLGDLKDLIRAGIKVVLGQYLSPIFLMLSIVFMLIYKGTISLDLLIIYLCFLLLSNVIIRFSSWHLPFSIAGQLKNSGRQILIGFLAMAIVIGTAAFHYFVLTGILWKLAAILILIVLNILWWCFGMNKEYVLERA